MKKNKKRNVEHQLIRVDKQQLAKIDEITKTLRRDLEGYPREKQLFYVLQLGIAACRTLVTIPREMQDKIVAK